jgi:DNA polymerase III subunit alpha, Gram-positive type
MKKETYVVLDIETTGLSKRTHKITEIAAVKVINNKIIQEFQTLINPQTRIPSFITSLTGINNQMVKDSPVIEEIMPRFLKFLGENPFVAHCATFDYGFLNHNTQTHFSQELTNPRICTRKLSRRLIPQLSSYKLSTLCEHFQVRNLNAHRAMGDVQATNHIFNNLIGLMQKQGIKNREDVLRFQDSRILK